MRSSASTGGHPGLRSYIRQPDQPPLTWADAEAINASPKLALGVNWSPNAQEAKGSQQARAEGVPARRRAPGWAGHARLRGTRARRPGRLAPAGPASRQPQRLVRVASARLLGGRAAGS